jgi:hypothetical protein
MELEQWTNRKQRGPERNSEDISPVIFISPICFHLNRVGNGNDDILSEEHFENTKTMTNFGKKDKYEPFAAGPFASGPLIPGTIRLVFRTFRRRTFRSEGFADVPIVHSCMKN